MTLLAPALLLGLVGLALPVVAHLLGREPPKLVRFAAMRFLREGEPVVTQRRRLRDRGLLAIRALLLALLVLILARPSSLGDQPLAVLAEPHDAIVLVDASMSMELRVDGRSEFDRALEIAGDVVDALPEGSRVGLVTNEPSGPKVAPSLATEAVVEALRTWREQTPENHGAMALADALAEAAAALGSSRERPRVIYAIGDRTAAGLGSLPPVGPDETAIVALPTRGSLDDVDIESPEHVAITEVSWSPAPEIDPRAIQIVATLRRVAAAGEDTLTVRVDLEIDGQSAPAEVDVPPHGPARVEFTHTLLDREAATQAAVRIVGRDDALPADDVRHLWISSQDRLEVTVVNGDPSELRAHDEVFFLATALRASDEYEHLELRSLAPDQLEHNLREHGRAAIAETDVLILANVRAPAADVAPLIIDRVREGMGLWITAGDRVAAREYNANLGEVLPLHLRGPVYAGTAPGRTQARTETFASPQLVHPIFTGLSGELGLAQTQTRRLFLLEPDAQRATSAALSFAGGAPALLTAEFGSGRVAMLTTSIDRDWSDLPLRPGFVPFVQRTVGYLGSVATTARGSVVSVGETKSLRSDRTLTVIAPGGETDTSIPGDDGLVGFTNTHHPGHYRVEREGAPTNAEVFAVQVDAHESDTSLSTVHVQAPDTSSVSAPGTVPRSRELLWPLALLLLAEVGWRWRRRMA